MERTGEELNTNRKIKEIFMFDDFLGKMFLCLLWFAGIGLGLLIYFGDDLQTILNKFWS